MPTNPTDDVIERAEAWISGVRSGRASTLALIQELVVRIRAAREDTRRLDWLETEIDRELAAISEGKPVPKSLFRSNVTIRREYIDAAIAAEEG